MIYTPPWLDQMQAEARLGILEYPGVKHHPRIQQYHSSTKGDEGDTPDEISWCSSCLCFCFETRGYQSPRSKWARSWLAWGIELSTPAYGCVCILSRGPLPQPGCEVISAPGHASLLLAIPTPWEVLVIAGNQTNQVNVRPFPIERVLGYRWPNQSRQPRT